MRDATPIEQFNLCGYGEEYWMHSLGVRRSSQEFHFERVKCKVPMKRKNGDAKWTVEFGTLKFREKAGTRDDTFKMIKVDNFP